ncbi:MAG TPA: hypothetical protein VLG40_05205 [Candidatus Saccharimonas sp.]|nr:hypothetical protein [Candidatus Saccharimonas sp.]
MEELELDFLETCTPQTAMQVFIDTLRESKMPDRACTWYNGIMVFAGPDDLATPNIVERLTWSLQVMLGKPWLLRQRSAVTDMVLEIEAMYNDLRRRLGASNISDPQKGLRLMVDLLPTLECPWGRITIGQVLEAFLQHKIYDGWPTVPYYTEAKALAHTQQAMKYLNQGYVPQEHWTRHARILLKLS